jgi:hypothetical protein
MQTAQINAVALCASTRVALSLSRCAITTTQTCKTECTQGVCDRGEAGAYLRHDNFGNLILRVLRFYCPNERG